MRTCARLLFALLCSPPSCLLAQSTQADLDARLLHKPLLLRGFWAKDKLHFDSAGKLLGDHAQLPFTLCGINVESVQLTPGTLVLEGRRVGISFDHDEREPIELTTGKKHDPERIHIEINAAPDYGPALDVIFASSLAELIPTLPAFWQRYALTHFPEHPATEPQSLPPTPPVARVGGSAKSPRLLHAVEPSYSEAARQLQTSGSVRVNIVVNEQGKVTTVNIVRPVGLGLDDEAAAAVARYTFAPALREGQPIAVEVNVDVNFQILDRR